MTKQELSTLLEIIDLSLKYGIPTVRNIFTNMNKEEITKEDIEKARIDLEWEDYYNTDTDTE